MIKLFCFISILIGGNLVNTVSDRAQLLTNGDKKNWYLFSETPGSNEPTCSPSGPVMADNTYTFFANGSFEFDHGTVTEDSTCTHDDCCTDFVNVVGSWRLANNQNGLVIRALYEKGKPDNAENIVIFSATINQLDESVLKFSQKDPETGVDTMFEFRKK